ncbi:MAG: fibro-slime domain-containing protein [Lachnoclostridium sp.]|nr:fibro-slime domain-containing protein [Lachnoclostridium sp.]
MIVKELKRLFTRKTIYRRVCSSLLAMLLVITSVLHPINMVPVYATNNWLQVNYQEQSVDDIEIYVQAESASFEPGETILLDVFVQNNSSKELQDFSLSLRDDKDVFTEKEFILTEDCGEASINEKGTVTNLSFAPGETKELQFEGTLDYDLDILNRREIKFFCGGYDENGEALTATTKFQFTVGLFNELSIDFTDGTELIPDETNTIEITMGFNDIGYYYETEDAPVATDSNAEIASDSDAAIATDSNAEFASDSDAYEQEEEEYVFDLTDITLDLATAGVKFEKVKLIEASVSEDDATITALVSYKVEENAEAGEYFGTLKANIKSGKKTYVSETAFQFEVVEVTDSTMKKSGLFTAELDNFTVNVEVAKGAFDEKVELVVTELAEDSEEFKTAEEAMVASEREFDGMMALDICFINEDGEEVEPNEGYSVQVSIEMNAEVLPEGIDTESLMVHHIAETATDDVQAEVELKVEDVADTADATDGIVEVKEVDEAPVVAAEFSVDGFSTFTITWSGGQKLEIKLIDSAGTEIGEPTSISASNSVTLSTNAPNISEYAFKQAVIAGSLSDAIGNNPTIVNSVRYQSSRWQYRTSSSSWNDIGNNQVYMIYDPIIPLETVETVDTRGLIRIDLADFSTSTQSIGTGNDTFRVGGNQTGWMNAWTGSGSGVVQGIVKDTLNADGYPDLNVSGDTTYNLNKFFGGDTTDSSITSYNDLSYLFRQDGDGYYYYDSNDNFAHVVQSQSGNQWNFEVYDVPHYDSTASGFDSGDDPQFLPLNDIRSPEIEGNPSYYPYAGNNESANYLFGMMVEFDFIMPKGGQINGKDMVFSFAGDDDVWVFIDGKLVLDMGGIHLSNAGSINFKTGAVTVDKIHTDNGKTESIDIFSDYSKHTLTFFYMERGEGGSNCNLRFNIQPIPEKSLTVTKELVADSSSSGETDVVKEYIKSSVEYKFRVLKVENGAVTDDLYVPAGTVYTLLENGKVVETDDPLTVDSEGCFYLKAGQSARFDNMLGFNSNTKATYVVQEIMPDGITGQYNGVEYVVNGAGGTTETGDINTTESSFTSFTSGELVNDETQYVIYNNKVDTSALSGLKVTKVVPPGAKVTDSEFDIKIMLGNSPSTVTKVPVGTKYKIVDINGNPVEDADGNEVREFDSDSIVTLKAGQSLLMVEGILAGTHYKVYEVIEGEKTYRASYSGTVSSSDDTDGTKPKLASDGLGMYGDFTPSDSVHITITNSDYDFIEELNLSKSTVGFEELDDASTFKFEVTPCTVTIADDVLTIVSVSKDSYVGTTISVPKKNPDSTSFTEKIVIGGRSSDYQSTDGNYYFKVTEIDEEMDLMQYDPTVYVVGIRLNADGTSDVSSVAMNGNPLDISESIPTLVFTNYYNNTSEMIISKAVTGNMADVNKSFTFTVTVNDADGNALNVFNSTNGTTSVETNTKTFTLKHGQSRTIENLPVGAKVTVTENADGYTAYYQVGSAIGSDTKQTGHSTVVTVANDTSDNILFINEKNAIIDTGISMDTLPYILIMLAVIGGIVFTIIRKRKDDDLD